MFYFFFGVSLQNPACVVIIKASVSSNEPPLERQ